MGNKYLTSSSGSGYSVNTNIYTGFNVAAGVSIGTGGFYASYYGIALEQISAAPSDSFNYGVINGRAGVLFDAAGTFNNDGTVASGGVEMGKYANTLINLGHINGGAFLSSAGGAIYNGTAIKPFGLIEGGVGAYAGKIANFSTIDSRYGQAITLSGAILTNGSGADFTATLTGGTGVYIKAAGGTVVNFATIDGTTPFTAYAGPESSGYGVWDAGGASVTNGQVNSRHALIEGYTGVGSTGPAATVTNFGEIDGLNPSGGAGVLLKGGGLVTNGAPTAVTAMIQGYTGIDVYGSGTIANYGTILADGVAAVGAGVAAGLVVNGSFGDLKALISGAIGVTSAGPGTVINYGRIEGLNDQGVLLAGGGHVINGLGVDRSATIEGLEGVEVIGAAGTVANFGTLIGDGNSSGVWLAKGGLVANGSAANGAALIEGYTGLLITGAGATTNFGTISGLGGTGHEGADINGGHITNGAAGHSRALIEGFTGVVGSGAATVINYGTIDGLGGTAVNFTSSTNVLEVEAGSSFIGGVVGGGGTLELGGGTWTHAGLLSSTGSITLSGPIAAATFNTFGTLDVAASADLAVTGNGAVAASQGLIVAGTLSTTGTIGSAGILTITGALGGTGTLALTGGTATFGSGSALTLAKVTQSGGAASFAAASTTLSLPWTQTAGTITVPTGDQLRFTGTGDVFSGTLAGAGTIDFLGGTDLISGATLSCAHLTIGGAAVTLAGTIGLTGAMSATTTDLAIAAAGATLTGSGSITLSNLVTNTIKGATASATLTNGAKLLGAGDIGGGEMTLVNEAGGIVDATFSVGLTLDTGANTIANAGLIENTATGGLVIKSAVNNTGVLTVTKGTLVANGAVSGAGSVRITGGVADFAGSFSENVSFTGATGVLELSHSQTYAGQISGFSKTGGTSLDLVDIGFTSGTTKAAYSGTAASGLLSVTDGTHTAKIHLTGDYATSSWTLSSDGHGGTTVVDPTRAAGAKPPVTTQPLVAAMAGFGGDGADAAWPSFGQERPSASWLTRPA